MTNVLSPGIIIQNASSLQIQVSILTNSVTNPGFIWLTSAKKE